MTDLDGMHARAVRGVAWAGLTQALSKGAAVLSTVVLARLLLPSDFGLFAVGLLIMNYLDRVKDVGVGAGLVYRREDWSRMALTGLPLSVVSAVVIALGAFVSAPVAAAFFRDPRAADLVRALSLALLVNGLSVVPESRLRRSLDFRRRLVPETAAALVKGGTSIALALAGYGVWSLVWGQVAGSVVQSGLYWSLSGWRPRMAWHGEDGRRLLRYGIPSASVAVFAVVYDNLDYLIIGRRMDPEQLGYYVLAFRVPELLIVGFCLVVSQVLFPLFSRLQDDLDALRASYLQAVRYVALVTVACGVLLALLAQETVEVLFSSRWEPAVPVLRVLALYAVVYSFSFHAGDIYKATGRPGILNTIGCVKLLVLVPALWVAAGRSITAVALAVLGANIGLTVLKLAVASRILSIPPLDYLRALGPPLLGSVAVVAVVLPLSTLAAGLPPAGRLAGLSAAGLVAYVSAVALADPALAAGLRRQLAGLLRQPVASRKG